MCYFHKDFGKWKSYLRYFSQKTYACSVVRGMAFLSLTCKLEKGML